MYTTSDLRTAVVKGQHALVKKIADNLKNQGIDFDEVVQLAIKKNQISSGAYSKVVAALA